MTSAFEAAAAAAAQQQQGTAQGVEDRMIDPAEQDAGRIDSRLFGGDRMPSILTKKHDVGDKVTGRIKDLPFEKQSRTFVEGGVGKLKFWPAVGSKPTEESHTNGVPNRPVMDLVIPLATEYQQTPAQLAEAGLNEADDDGTRAWFIGSAEAEKAFKDAIKRARIRSSADLVGMNIEIERGPKVQKGDNKAWTYKVELSRS